MERSIQSWLEIGHALNGVYNAALFYHRYDSEPTRVELKEAILCLKRALLSAPKAVRLAFAYFLESIEDED